ncbi:MAG: MBL fold metallo-hydrolase [Candidatus Brennerbacteria bacterium]
MQILASFLERSKPRIFGVLAVFFVLNAFLFALLGSVEKEAGSVAVLFLDVGQGDASLVELGEGVQMLIDGGPPNGRLLAELGEIMLPYDRTIELVVLTHPEVDHYGGLIELLGRYEVGMFIDAGVTKEVEAYEVLVNKLAEYKIRRTTLRAGDRIRYGGQVFSIISPDDTLVSAREKNDTSMVLAFESSGARFLFTGDIGANVERIVAKKITEPFDVLKIAHHGSKFSSAAEFLFAVRPTLAAIGVGKNSYGHPTRETLARLETVGARVYRTDRDGTITIRVESGAIRTFVER